MHLQQYFQVSQAPNLVAFERELAAAAAHLGFGLFNSFLVVENPPKGQVPAIFSVNNIPSAYVDAAFDPENVAKCPLIKRYKSLSIPFAYDQSVYVAAGVQDLWESAAPYGYKVGMGVALHLPNAQHFVLSMDREAPLPKAEGRMARLLADLQLLAVHAEAAASRLLLPSLLPPTARLSPRELEALRWTVQGKTAWEIGAILGISERSAVFHLANATRKLDAVNKHQAALKALRFGLIQ